MRHIAILVFIFLFEHSYSQELDIYQNDSIYAKNKISKRTMYSVNGETIQKEIVTQYEASGKKLRQFWYWNGEKDFHNVETFYYSNKGLLSSLTDSSANGNVEVTTYNYDNGILRNQVTFNQLHDTSDFRLYPEKNITIQRWYVDDKPYRFDTTLFEQENVKLEYYGIDNSYNSKWHYSFLNEFDSNGNLVKVLLKQDPHSSFTKYIYDSRNLLIKKQKILFATHEKAIQSEYLFTYE